MMWDVWLCRHHMASIWQIYKKKLIRSVGYDSIQLVTISRPSAYGEYEPYHFLKTEQEFEEAVKNL